MLMVDRASYEGVTAIVGLKIVPGMEDAVCQESGSLTGISHTFKAFGSFDVIVFLTLDHSDVPALLKRLKKVEGVLDVHPLKFVP